MGVVSVNQILVALAFITLISEASSNGVVELHEDSWYQVTKGVRISDFQRVNYA